MKKRLVSNNKKRSFPVFWIFLTGFIAGVFLPNLVWKLEWRQKTISSLYLISTFAGRTGDDGRYLWQVLRMRGSFYLLAAFSGVSVFGAPLAVVTLFVCGFQTGAVLAVSVLQFGLQGGVAGASLFFPQHLIYFPCLFYLMSKIYGQSLEIWKNRGLFPRKVSDYVLGVLICGLAYTGGILLEVFLNPKIVETVMGSLKIF